VEAYKRNNKIWFEHCTMIAFLLFSSFDYYPVSLVIFFLPYYESPFVLYSNNITINECFNSAVCLPVIWISISVSFRYQFTATCSEREISKQSTTASAEPDLQVKKFFFRPLKMRNNWLALSELVAAGIYMLIRLNLASNFFMNRSQDR
jgi:hypothetical protein